MLAVSVLLLLALLIAAAMAVYNGLVRSRVRVREAWSGIEIQLRRRASLLPKLMESVQAYAAHERGTFEAVARARSAVERAGGAAEAAQASQQLSGALGRLFAVAERYPQLRASESFVQLQAEISDVEEKIAYARQFYNQNAMDYNTRLEVLPGVLIARSFAFRPVEFFEADDEGLAEVRLDFAPPERSPSLPSA